MTSTRSIPAKADSLNGRIAALEDRFRNELMDPDERCELRDRIIRLKKKAGAR